ncbi:MAG: phosphate ABC transporter permease subunit PstC [Bdellovibrionaceae bacterium]|nr:phosphate ABC transporter permease subunit PstC [Pseudobdellovibrionaceae bacterium]
MIWIRRRRKIQDRCIEAVLFLAAASSIFVTLAIVYILVSESLPFFKEVSLKEFLTGQEWTPLFANPSYGIRPLISGTLMTTIIALLVAIPLGTIAAAFLSEYVKPRLREILKPLLELLAAVPTVVYGYFALLFVTPILQKIFPSLSGFNVLSAGLVIGIMIVPYVSSLSEDAMRSVPIHLREASFALGSSRLQTVFRVVIPAAFSGMTSAYILAISRALGETMVVAIAAGMQPNLTWNPLEPSETITAFIVQVSLGDLPHGSIGYRSIYVAGLTLLVITLSLNIFGVWLRKKYQEKE